jgi:hypothetical protein
MGPLGSFIRLIPLQLDELPSHPALETRFRNSIGRADRKNGTRPAGNPQALRDVSNVSQNRPNVQMDTPADLKDGFSSPGEDPDPLYGSTESTPDSLHNPDDGISSDASTFDHTGRPNLIPFIKAILDEATTFVDITIPRTFFEGSLKSSSPSTAKVRLLKRTISGNELSQIPWERPRIPRKGPPGIKPPSEAWFARSSTHTNQNLKGSADFSEFDFALRADHSQHEREYTPDVFDDFKVLDWDLRPTPYNLAIGNYRHITMGSEYLPRFPVHSISLLAGIMLILDRLLVYEMCHKLPFPLAPRVFPVLVITAETGAAEFVVVQIPVNLESLPEAFYSNGRNLKEGRSALQKKKPVLGYVRS